MVRRMDRDREDRIRPLLAFHLVPWQAKLVKLRVQNVGAGPAFGVSGAIEATSSNGDKVGFRWSYPLLAAGKYEEFGFPTQPGASGTERFNLDAVRARVEGVEAHFTYKSASGRQYELVDRIGIKDITDDWIGSQMLATQDHPERLLPRMAKALDEIAKTIQDRLRSA